MTGRAFLFHGANPREMGGITTHTLEVWDPEHVDTSWAQAHPSIRGTYEGSELDPGHRPIASMSWHHKTGEIKGIYTSPQFQRQGVASSMWQEGHRLAEGTRGVPAPKHSPQRTTAGDAWARAVGGRLPRRGS
jgi:hypothetical protein